MARLNTVQVCAELERFKEPALMGALQCQAAGVSRIFSFAYHPSWLQQPEVFAFDPDLALVAGSQYPAPNRTTFGIFLDSSPDRWGRVLMQRRENIVARQEGRRPRALGAWELVAHRLAAKAGIVVPEARPFRLPDSSYTTFLVRRFDRTPKGGRRAFVSAMTLTQRIDGDAGASYLELVDVLQSRGADTQADCEQLFRRVVFSILIHNTDDHLRNHGFFIEAHGIRLSPAYDINPSVERRELSLAINEVETACDVSIAMDACQDYGLTRRAADGVLKHVRAVVGKWRSEAGRLGIPRAEQDLMATAFEV